VKFFIVKVRDEIKVKKKKEGLRSVYSNAFFDL
jgi:hypothetical protein